MWGTPSPGDKLTGDFGNEPDATSISDRGLFRLLAGNLSPGVSDFANTICNSRHGLENDGGTSLLTRSQMSGFAWALVLLPSLDADPHLANDLGIFLCVLRIKFAKLASAHRLYRLRACFSNNSRTL